ncbi:MAG: NAD-dependent epimerase/dehydratase family protein [Planctomycetes bacterium]|nr:NAD-dependent epimerase/dehydratase family protein [Planctomycetota bacterium]
MRTDRREFLTASLAAGAILATRAHATQAPAQSAKPLDVLVFGGTGLIGPPLVELLVARGHKVVLFNRGKTKTDLFPDLERIVGDRDPSKDRGVAGLEGRKFDLVFDDTGYYPRHVRTSSEILAKAGSGHIVFVSSISAYAKNDVVGADETAELARLADPTVETMGAQYENYGGLKVLCEEAAAQAFEGRATIVRPGYIVGPGDSTDRFTYWPLRFRRGGQVLVPGAPTDPIQVIDVRDLADLMVKVGEARARLALNACGPKGKLEWGQVIEECQKAAGGRDVSVRWASLAELQKLGPLPFPIWAPFDGESKGFHTWSNQRAIAAGATFRPIAATIRDTLAWFDTLPEERRGKLRAGLTAELEAQALAKL